MQPTSAQTTTTNRLRQGDILRDVHWVEYVIEKDGNIEVSKVVFPLAIILTQDCDLAQDHLFRVTPQPSQDKYLISVLLAPLYNVEHVYLGEHLSELDIRMAIVPKKRSAGDFLRDNKRPRYHYLEFDNSVPIAPSVIDFKHYFSATVSYLNDIRSTSFVCSIDPLFREDIAQRFASYLSRIGLPTVRGPSS